MRFVAAISQGFRTCLKPNAILVRQKSHLVYTCDFEAATLARQKLHRVAATKIACVNGPLDEFISTVLPRANNR